MNAIHGYSKTKVYHAWNDMKRRCFNENSPDFENYGGRGITVCDRWMTFTPFLEDMGEPPTKMHSLDRIDPDGNYEPKNCRWASLTTQSRNRSPHRNKYGCPGVSPFRGRYRATIWVRSNPIHLGYFATVPEAIEARKRAERKYWGETA